MRCSKPFPLLATAAAELENAVLGSTASDEEQHCVGLDRQKGQCDFHVDPSPRGAGANTLARVDIQPLIVVTDVEASSRWYQEALGLRSVHGGPEYERLAPPGGGDDDFVLQLHKLDADEHPGLIDPEQPPGANGVALWFRTDDFDGAVERARAAAAEIVNGPLVNDNARHRELWLRDPDGYVVVIAGAKGT